MKLYKLIDMLNKVAEKHGDIEVTVAYKELTVVDLVEDLREPGDETFVVLDSEE